MKLMNSTLPPKRIQNIIKSEAQTKHTTISIFKPNLAQKHTSKNAINMSKSVHKPNRKDAAHKIKPAL
jgi:hypothetical protein